MKNVVTIGGGTGTYVVLSGLKEHPLHLSAIVTMADDGGSTGMLRDQYGVLPAGDLRRALVALSDSSGVLRNLFNYRFEGGDSLSGKESGLSGHSFGNLFLFALEKVTGDFTAALREASNLLNIDGEVVPVTLDDVRLYAKLENGKVLHGENQVNVPRSSVRARIEKVWLVPEPRMNPAVRRVLHAADMIVIGPGDIYSSIVPNLLVKGVPEAIRASKAKKVYVCNAMTKFGETDGFSANDFVAEIEHYLGKGVLDYVIFNTKRPSPAFLKKYEKEKSEFVEPPSRVGRGKGGSRASASLPPKPKHILAEVLDGGGLVRHNSRKLAKVLVSLL